MHYDYDVIVVGAGGAGMSCSIIAHDAGARVLLVEATGAVGGSTALSGGVTYAAGTSVQRAHGVLYDSAERMFAYYMTFNQWLVDPAVGWRYCQETAPTIEWLLSLGVRFTELHAPGVDGVPRSHVPEGEGPGMVRALEVACGERSIDVAFGRRVDALVTDGTGAVVGVRSGEEVVRAPSVVLTTGGFGQNREMVEEYYPDAAGAGDWGWSIAASHSVGDGITLGRQVGASIAGRNRGLLLTTTGLGRVNETPLPGWLMLVNDEGMRFVDELAGHSVMTGTIKKQGGRCFAVFDEPMRARAEPHPENVHCQRASVFTPEELAAGVEKGLVAKGETLEEVGARLGVPGDALAAAAARYTAHAAAGHDAEFFKDPSALRPIETPPFYGMELRPGIIAFTSCGLRIDPTARVLDRTGTPIPGLYAAGETTGNVNGKRYLGGGNGVGNCLCFGRISGASASAHALAVRGEDREPV